MSGEQTIAEAFVCSIYLIYFGFATKVISPSVASSIPEMLFITVSSSPSIVPSRIRAISL